MSSLVDASTGWGWVKVTIAAGPAATQASARPIRSCMVYHYSGTGTYMSYSEATATTSAPALPTTLATAVSMPVENLNQLWFIGTANDVVMIIYRD